MEKSYYPNEHGIIFGGDGYRGKYLLIHSHHIPCPLRTLVKKNRTEHGNLSDPAYVMERKYINLVNCPVCVGILRSFLYHCPSHGFVSEKDVTNDEKCNICGTPLTIAQ